MLVASWGSIEGLTGDAEDWACSERVCLIQPQARLLPRPQRVDANLHGERFVHEADLSV